MSDISSSSECHSRRERHRPERNPLRQVKRREAEAENVTPAEREKRYSQPASQFHRVPPPAKSHRKEHGHPCQDNRDPVPAKIERHPGQGGQLTFEKWTGDHLASNTDMNGRHRDSEDQGDGEGSTVHNA